MTVNLSYFAGAGWQFFGNDGVPLSGGLVYTYLAGTTTPATTYTSNTGLISNSNPIVLDSAGRTPNQIWLTPGSTYKFVLQTSAGVTIYTQDNISAINDFTELSNTTNVAQGDALIGFKQANAVGIYTGAVGKTVHDKLQEFVSVEDFGASVNNTPAQNRAAIQAAIDTGVSVCFNGFYTVDDTLYVNERQRLFSNVGWRETSSAGLNFKFNATANKNCITGKNLTTRSLQGCVFDGLRFQIDKDCVFSDTITVNMISGSGRYIQILNCWSANYAFSQLAQNVLSITSVANVATVTKNNHGLSNGDVVRMVGVSTPQVAGDAVYNGIFSIQNVTTNTFDYVMSGTPTNASANINTFKSGYFPKRDLSGGVTGVNINFSSFLYLDPLKTGAVDNGNAANYNATFELLVTGCTTGNFYRDIYLQGRSPTTGDIGLIVAPIMIGNQFNSINPDYQNAAGNVFGSNVSNLMLTNNIYGSLSNNINIAGDSGNVGINNNYYEQGNSGTRRVTINNNTVNTLVNEFSVDSANGSVYDNSTAGTYTAYGYFGIQLKGGSLLDRYEEGTWTPALEPTTGSFTSITYGYQSGKYVRIGGIVTVQCLLSVDAINVGTSSGVLKVTGLPFKLDWGANGVGNAYSDAPCYSINWASAAVQPNQVRLISDRTYLVPQIVNSGAPATDNTVANLATVGPGINWLSFTMTYKVQ